MNRRALLGGVACVGGALLAQKLKPHRYVSLLSPAKLEDLIPRNFGGWTSEDVGDPLALNAPGTLSAKLYNQMVTRAYTNLELSKRVWILLAHGERQNDELQLHRPETCYPAFGFALIRNEPIHLPVLGGVTVPARRLLCRAPDREERVVYWTRMGEFLPIDAPEQRVDRFKNAIAGIVPDGVLCRFSITDPLAQSWDDLESFVPEFLAATGPRGRRVLLGTQRAHSMDAARA